MAGYAPAALTRPSMTPLRVKAFRRERPALVSLDLALFDSSFLSVRATWRFALKLGSLAWAMDASPPSIRSGLPSLSPFARCAGGTDGWDAPLLLGRLRCNQGGLRARPLQLRRVAILVRWVGDPSRMLLGVGLSIVLVTS
jgi:hypothetical protein